MQVHEYKCENGLKVFIAPVKGSGKVSGAFVARGGWKYESSDAPGIAHKLEHIMLDGTTNRPSTFALAEEIEDIGGRIHAHTDNELIVFFCHVPSPQHIYLLCDVLADIILNPLFDEDGGRIELAVLVEELRKEQSDPMVRLDILFSQLLFGDHPFALPGVGTEKSLRSISYERLEKYYQSCFVSENCALFIAGEIKDHEKLFAEINKLFRPLIPGASSLVSPELHREQAIPEFVSLKLNTRQIFIKLGVSCRTMMPEDEASMKVVKTILGSGWTSRLYEELISKRGLVYDYNLECYLNGLYSYFAYVGGINRTEWLDGIEVILECMGHLAKTQVSNRVLERAKVRSALNEQSDVARPHLAVSYMLNEWQNFKPVTLHSHEQTIQQIMAVTRDDVIYVTRKFFQNNSLNLATIGPIRETKETIKSILHF